MTGVRPVRSEEWSRTGALSGDARTIVGKYISRVRKGRWGMASLNRVIIMGNLGQDPELRYTQSQAPVCTLRIATTDYRTSADGQRQEFTEWHSVVVWNKQAENCAKYLAKGRSVLVEGRLQTRSWEDKQGNKRYTTEIVAQNVQFVGGGQGRDRQAPGMGQQPAGGAYGGSSYGGGVSPGYGAPAATPSAGGAGVGGAGGAYGHHDPDLGGGMNDAGGFGGPETPSLDDIPF